MLDDQPELSDGDDIDFDDEDGNQNSIGSLHQIDTAGGRNSN